MADPTEPTNEQLAKFLVVRAKTIPEVEDLELDAKVLESVLKHDPKYRRYALQAHRRFLQQIDEMFEKMEQGQLQCAHIRPNDKHCPNFNEPGSFYCGLHKDEDD